MTLTVGDSVPSTSLHENTPKEHVDLAELSSGKKLVAFAVPGAFTPGCDKTHLPGYLEDIEKFKEKGVDEVVCIAVNDAFVMSAWGNAHDAEGKVRMLADPQAEFTKAMGLDVDAPALGGTRSKRYSMVIENGKITTLNVEPDGFGLTCSLASPLLEAL